MDSKHEPRHQSDDLVSLFFFCYLQEHAEQFSARMRLCKPQTGNLDPQAWNCYCCRLPQTHLQGVGGSVCARSWFNSVRFRWAPGHCFWQMFACLLAFPQILAEAEERDLVLFITEEDASPLPCAPMWFLYFQLCELASSSSHVRGLCIEGGRKSQSITLRPVTGIEPEAGMGSGI